MSWIERLPSGGLRLVDRVKISGKTKRVSVSLDRDTPQAIRKATEALNEKIEQLAHEELKGSKIALNEAVTDYLDLKDCRESTRIYNASLLKTVVEIFGDRPLSSLSAAEIRRTFYKLEKPPQVINRIMMAFKTFCRWCVDMDYIQDDPTRNLRLLKVIREEKDPEELYLEPDALANVLDHLHGMAYYMTRFLVLTGCRIGEAAALTPEDIGDKYISITKSYSSTSHMITRPKNSSSIRDVFIQPELRELINEYLKWRNLDMMAYGIRPETLFYSRTGTIYQERYYRIVLQKLGTHPHALRHTHVALLAEQGMSLEAIARRIGHKGKGTTEAVYYHVTKKQRQKDEEKMSSIRIL
jgi:integrase